MSKTQKQRALWVTMFKKKMAGFISVKLEKEQEDRKRDEWDNFAVYHSVNRFAKWNPKLNSDEMNVLINWQSGADMRLIENVSLSTNNFHCLEPYADFHLWQPAELVDN